MVSNLTLKEEVMSKTQQTVALYLRVSTSSQTTDNQRRELETYCKRQQWKISKVYEDAGVSGAKNDRPALNEILRDARKGKFDVVCVWKIDRLARSTIHLLNVLTELNNAGVGFVSTTQAIDTTTSYGKMVLTFLGAIAEFERDTICERVKAGLSRAKEQGVRLGRPRVGFDVNEAIRLKKAGMSWSKLAGKLNVSSATLRRTLYPLLKTPAGQQARMLAQ